MGDKRPSQTSTQRRAKRQTDRQPASYYGCNGSIAWHIILPLPPHRTAPLHANEEGGGGGNHAREPALVDSDAGVFLLLANTATDTATGNLCCPTCS